MAVDTPTTTTEEGQEPDTSGKGQFGAINTEVAKLLGDRNAEVRTAVVKELVDEKMATRTKLAARGVALIRQFKNELQRQKPEVTGFDADGKATMNHYSKTQVELRQRWTQNIAKLESSLAKAFDKAEYGDLESAVAKAEKCAKGEKE